MSTETERNVNCQRTRSQRMKERIHEEMTFLMHQQRIMSLIQEVASFSRVLFLLPRRCNKESKMHSKEMKMKGSDNEEKQMEKLLSFFALFSYSFCFVASLVCIEFKSTFLSPLPSIPSSDSHSLTNVMQQAFQGKTFIQTTKLNRIH